MIKGDVEKVRVVGYVIGEDGEGRRRTVDEPFPAYCRPGSVHHRGNQHVIKCVIQHEVGADFSK